PVSFEDVHLLVNASFSNYRKIFADIKKGYSLVRTGTIQHLGHTLSFVVPTPIRFSFREGVQNSSPLNATAVHSKILSPGDYKVSSIIHYQLLPQSFTVSGVRLRIVAISNWSRFQKEFCR